MLPTDLESYLIKCRDQRLPFEVIAQNLVTAGWGADDVLSAKSWYLKEVPEIKAEPSTKMSTQPLYSTPPSTEKFPTQRFPAWVWLALFVVMTILTVLIMNTFSQ